MTTHRSHLGHLGVPIPNVLRTPPTVRVVPDLDHLARLLLLGVLVVALPAASLLAMLALV